jgi:hypothetical protein
LAGKDGTVKTMPWLLGSEAAGRLTVCSVPAAKNERRHAPTKFISVI